MNPVIKFLSREGTAMQSPEINFASRHVPYVTVLYERLQAAARLIDDRRAYLREANTLGVQTAALTQVANVVIADEAELRRSRSAYDRIRQLLAFAEPTTPNEDWYCGHLQEPPRDKDNRYPRENWPHRYSSGDTLVFAGAMPISALRALALATPLVDDFRVYSPSIDDFRVLRSAPRDPVLIGLITFLGQRSYFAVARWDIDRDLAAIVGGSAR
jgi:hypothetical protein